MVETPDSQTPAGPNRRDSVHVWEPRKIVGFRCARCFKICMNPTSTKLPPCEDNAPESEIPCCRCGGVVVEFSVPHDAWNILIRDDGKETDQEYLCLECFARLAAEKVKQLREMMFPLVFHPPREHEWGCAMDAIGFYVTDELGVDEAEWKRRQHDVP